MHEKIPKKQKKQAQLSSTMIHMDYAAGNDESLLGDT